MDVPIYFLDTDSQIEIFTFELNVQFVSLEPHHQEWVQESSCAV